MPPGRSIKQGKEWPGHALGMLWACSEQVLVRGCYCSSQANSRRRTIFLEIPDESVLYVLYCTVSCVQTRQVPGVEAAAELPRLGGITRPEDANTAALSDRRARMWLSVLSLRRTQLRIVRTVGRTLFFTAPALCETAVSRSLRFQRRHQLTVDTAVPFTTVPGPAPLYRYAVFNAVGRSGPGVSGSPRFSLVGRPDDDRHNDVCAPVHERLRVRLPAPHRHRKVRSSARLICRA